MSLKIMNEAFKRKYSDVLTESVDESYKAQLKKALVMRSMNIVSNGGNIKDLEIALQGVIEEFFPDKSWWEVTDCNIFMELLGGANPREVCDMIVDQIKDDCCDESLDEGYSAETLELERKPELEKDGEFAIDETTVRAYAIKGSGWNRISGIDASIYYSDEYDIYGISISVDGKGVNNEKLIAHLEKKFPYLDPNGEGAYSLETCINKGLVPMIDYLLYQLDDDELGNICNESLKEAKTTDNPTVDIWLEELPSHYGKSSIEELSKKDLLDEIDEAKSTIANERIWARTDPMHEDNISDLQEYIEVLKELISDKDAMKEAVSNPERTISKVDKNLSKEVDKDLVRDLTLCIENDGEVYRRSITPVIKNLKRKKAKGQFDEKLAIQAFFHVVEGALRMPHFYRYYTYNISTVSVPERYAVAKNLLEGAMDEIEFEETAKNENFSIAGIKK